MFGARDHLICREVSCVTFSSPPYNLLCVDNTPLNVRTEGSADFRPIAFLNTRRLFAFEPVNVSRRLDVSNLVWIFNCLVWTSRRVEVALDVDGRPKIAFVLTFSNEVRTLIPVYLNVHLSVTFLLILKMSGGRQTGTVPKTKHNTRTRRENTVNHIPNNLDWHDSYQPQRARKESNTSASRHSDAGDDIYEDNPWIGLAPQTHRSDDDEVRWSNVKSSNLTPERSATHNIDAYMIANRSSLLRQENAPEERDGSSSSKEALSRGRIKLRMEQRKIEELQQHQAVLLTLRNKAIQQVKPVQASNVEELHPQPSSLMNLRNKAIQQVKPVQQEEMDRVGNLSGGIQNIQDYANIIQVLERDDGSSNLESGDGQSEQQLRKKLNDLLAKKAQVDSILAYIDSDHAPDATLSLSSDEGEGFSRPHGSGDADDGRREVTKQDNREQATSTAYLQIKEFKLEDIKNKLEQLQTMLARVERTSVRDTRSAPRMNGETSSHCSDTPMQAQIKNCPSMSILDKVRAKKIDLDHIMRKVKSNPTTSNPPGFTFNQANVENWAAPSQGTTQASGVDYSSDEAEADYDESPVKLCSTSLQSYLPQSPHSKSRGHAENITNSAPILGKYPATSGSRSESRGCSIHLDGDDRVRQQPQMSLQDVNNTANNTALALQISQLQLQMEQMQMLYQNMLEKQQVNVFPSPQPWLPPNNMGFMQYMPPSAQWHQHQLLVNSLNQCCQLIWHQQRELAGLRQALTMLQEEGSIYKCPTTGYGNNLNFDAGLIWTQPSPQMLNNQVPPGNRANNYWDNFRSYSRQNLLSGRNKSNEGSLADSLPTPRPSPQTDNLRPKDNSSSVEGRAKVLRCRQQHQDINGPNFVEQNSGRPHNGRRFNTCNKNTKPESVDVHSLEQSVYSELETVITESERSPDMLLQLLTRLKSMRSRHQQQCSSQDNLACLENDCDIMEPGSSLYSRMEHPRNQTSSMSYDHDGSKLETVLEEINRLVHECDICTPELLQQIVGLIMRAFHLSSHHEIVTRLEASLLKFQGVRIGQIGDELLCVIASVLSPHVSSSRSTSHVIEERDSGMVDQIEEEGAVGGVLLTSSQRSTAQSVETELAEADQPQHNPSDNIEVFDTEDAALPGIELDNQELPPREGNSEQPIQET